MTIESRTTTDFWQAYHLLSAEVKELARKNYRLWCANPFHPSLHFKKIGGSNWSVRVGGHYRAMGRFVDSAIFLWEWIGTHEQYNHRY